jgi:hypothetical protein
LSDKIITSFNSAQEKGCFADQLDELQIGVNNIIGLYQSFSIGKKD